MVVFGGFLMLFLAITGHSSAATYCICKDGVGDSVLQKNIDYACGAGASCSPILEKGACYNPNTVKDHCNYAVNSYFQNKGQAVGTCDFSSTATTTQTLTSQSSTCIFPTSASSNTPSTGTNTGTTFGQGPSSFSDDSKAATIYLHRTFHFFFWPFILILLRP